MYSCNCTFLLRLVFIVFAFALLIVANPVPQGSTDFRDIDGEPMPAEETLSIDEFNPLDGIDDLISSNNPGSSNGADCALRSSRNADNSQENPIFRRGPAACRSNYQTPGEPSVERPVHLEGKPATYQESACTKVHRQKHLWCGGPEVRYTPNDRIVFVMNCVSGGMYTVIRPRPLYPGGHAPFEETRKIAEYCCSTFEDKYPGYRGVLCDRVNPNVEMQIWDATDLTDFDEDWPSPH